VERSRRVYFLLLAIAGVFGWSVGVWAAPIVAFALLETAWTAVEWTRERGAGLRPVRPQRRRYVR